MSPAISLRASGPSLAAPLTFAPLSAPAPISAAAPAPAPLMPVSPLQSAAAVMAAPALAAQAWDGALVSGGASADFVSAVRDHVARAFPDAVQRSLAAAGYRVEANAHVRQNRPKMAKKNDLTGGYHAHGPGRKLIIIGETVREKSEGTWGKSRNWENAVNHEFGLAINRTLGDAAAKRAEAGQPKQAAWYRAHGISESPDFREAWRRDFSAIPPELKQEKDEDGESNDFYYFLKPDKNRTFHQARERTFAEGLDVLLRGPSSAYNYDDFTLHFPRVLAQIRREMESSFAWKMPEPPSAPKLGGAWESPNLSSGQLAELLVSGAARPEFVAKVRALAARTFPPDLIRDLLKSGYRVAADESVRQGREGLHEDNDTRGGFHSHGGNGNLIVVAERLKLIGSARWVESEYWENAVIHEIGHALAYIHGEAEVERAALSDPRQARWYRRKGLSESPAFREAWNRDFDAMPAELKKQWTADKLQNFFYYYVHPDAGGWYQRARQETYAEGFDVLLRGPRSSFNQANFTRYFPRALAEIRRDLGSRYPGLVFGSAASSKS
jgi:hypothetical protein